MRMTKATLKVIKLLAPCRGGELYSGGKCLDSKKL